MRQHMFHRTNNTGLPVDMPDFKDFKGDTKHGYRPMPIYKKMTNIGWPLIFSLLWKSMATICLVTNILQNIFYYVTEDK